MKLSPWILCSCIASLFAYLRRALFRLRRRRSSDPGLPTKGPSLGGGGLGASLNGSNSQHYGNVSQTENSGVDLAWDDWGDGAPMTSVKVDPTDPPAAHHPHSNTQTAPSLMRSTSVQEEEEEDTVDYFADMMPSYKKPATIRKKTSQQTPGLSNRLALGVDETAVLTDELGAWTEGGNAWEEETVDDLSWEADQVIREKKQAERERRAAEQRRKKIEKEAQRMARKDSGKLATKLK